MLRKSLISAALGLTLLISGCSDTPNEQSTSPAAASEFLLSDTYGKPITVVKKGAAFDVKGHEGKVILFDIFATWCPPCRATAPHLTSLQKKYADELLVLGVTIEDDKTNADLEAFKTENQAEYTIVNSEENRPLYSAIASAIHVGQRFPIPLMVLYKDGKYLTHYVGATPEEMIESDIKQALGK